MPRDNISPVLLKKLKSWFRLTLGKYKSFIE